MKSFNMKGYLSLKQALELYLVTDSTWLNGRPLCEAVEKAIKNGVTCVQLREKELAHQDFYNEAMVIKELCRIYRVPFIINDNLQVALLSSADGLHIGQEDGSIKSIRQQWKNKILGVSVQTLEQAKEAELEGADYLGVGAVFQTGTKNDAIEVSINTLQEICQKISIPIVAIGGIQRENLIKLSNIGISGIAVVSAILAADDIGIATQELKDILKKVVK